MTPEQRRLRAATAADARWAREPDRSAAVQPAVEGRLLKLEAEIDPDGTMHPGERRQRAEQLRRSQMRALALKSSLARAGRKAGAT